MIWLLKRELKAVLNYKFPVINAVLTLFFMAFIIAAILAKITGLWDWLITL